MNEHAHDDHAGGHGSLRSYIIGFLLSVVLTVIPFWLVLGRPLESAEVAIFIIFALGAVQMVVHLHYFLHVSLKVDEGWQVMALLFTVLLLAIVLAGSLWVMFHLHENMMPAHEQIERIRNLP
ncbi:cytochrome o ubiquinol oxidase subunit IV [Amaricoccus macauensis]|uniref:cytochrome o ubiquinol oxidase subunit IV n=1 Tax=Amaricoccus macauensis TaxID=57001 RepID=UPI003C7B0B31